LGFSLFGGDGREVAAPFDVAVNVSALGITLYADAVCSRPLAPVYVRRDGGFFYSGTMPGSFAVSLTSLAVDSAMQIEQVTDGGGTGTPALAFTNAPVTALAGTCAGPLTLNATSPTTATLT